MTTAPKRQGAPASALTVSIAELAGLRGAPHRLQAAETAHARALAALHDAQAQRGDLDRQVSEARGAAHNAKRTFEAIRREPAERGVTVTTLGDGQNPANIGLQPVFQNTAHAPSGPSALDKLNIAHQRVATLEALIKELDAEIIPAAQRRAGDAAVELQEAQTAAERLELAKANDAAPVLIAADAAFIEAGAALERAREAAERTRADLAKTYGADDRFAAKHLVHGLPVEIARLATHNHRAPTGAPADLLAMHRNAFDLED